MDNETLKLIWNKGITYEEYLYLYDNYGEGLLTVPASLVSLERLRSKGYLEDYTITPKGLDLISEILGQKSIQNAFEEFWNLFPTKDRESGRELRHSYMEAMNLYATASSEFGHENLMSSLRKEIAFRESLPTKFKYMKGIVNYLNTKEYRNVRDEVQAKRQYGKAVY